MLFDEIDNTVGSIFDEKEIEEVELIEEVAPINEEPKQYRVTVKLNLREEPSKLGKIIRVLNKNEVIAVIDDSDDEWAMTEEGFCMKKFLVLV